MTSMAGSSCFDEYNITPRKRSYLAAIFFLAGPYFLMFWRERRTYKTQLILIGISSIIGFIQFGLLGYFLSTGGKFQGINAYGDNIIGFLITGAIGSSMLLMIMRLPKESIQDEQRTGTLEIISVSTLGLEVVIGTRMLVNFVSTVVTSTALIFVFFFVFEVPANINIAGLVISIFVGAALMSGIGLCAAGYVLNSKAGEPFTWTVTTIMGLFSGVMFPVELYPAWLANLANYIPTTVIMTAFRTTTMTNSTTIDTLKQLSPAFVGVFIFVPMGIAIYRWGLRKARTKGSIGQY